MALTKAERETVILFSDDGDMATVSTHMRRIMTKLDKNPAASLIEDLSTGGVRGARYTIPSRLISFRTGKRRPDRGHPCDKPIPGQTTIPVANPTPAKTPLAELLKDKAPKPSPIKPQAALEILECAHDGHTWTRKPARGRKPKLCPEHK